MDNRFVFVNKPLPPTNWEQNNMAIMICNMSLPRGTRLYSDLIEYILEFIPESFDPPQPPPPPPPPQHVPEVIIDNYNNIWTSCSNCNTRVCFSVSDDWDHLISCTLPDGDITQAICYNCEDQNRNTFEDDYNYIFQAVAICEDCRSLYRHCHCDNYDDRSDDDLQAWRSNSF